jgi:hypothetical protein
MAQPATIRFTQPPGTMTAMACVHDGVCPGVECRPVLGELLLARADLFPQADQSVHRGLEPARLSVWVSHRD